MDERVEGSQDRVAALEGQLEVVLQRLDVLEDENRALRSSHLAPAAGGVGGLTEAPASDTGVTRRRLLVGSVGAAAVGAAAMVGGATPAAANGLDGSWTLGQLNNTATTP